MRGKVYGFTACLTSYFILSERSNNVFSGENKQSVIPCAHSLQFKLLKGQPLLRKY